MEVCPVIAQSRKLVLPPGSRKETGAKTRGLSGLKRQTLEFKKFESAVQNARLEQTAYKKKKHENLQRGPWESWLNINPYT